MINIKPQLQNLINTKFNKSQKEKVEEMLSYEKDRFIIDYTILSIALEKDLIILSTEEIEKFYNIENIHSLNVVDILIAKIITTLSHLLNVDVKLEFENRLTLDKKQPELIYLIKLINEEYYK